MKLRNLFAEIFSILILVSLCSSLFFTSEAFSKTRKKRRVVRHSAPWLMGVHGGVNFAFASSEPSRDGSTRQGFVVGVHFEKKIQRWLWIQPEFRFIQKGVKTTLFQILGSDVTGTVKLDSLQFPLMFKAKFGNLRFSPYVIAGPWVALALQREIELLSLVALGLNNRFSWFDFGFDLGGGIEFLVTARFKAFLNVRYALGLLDLDRNSNTYQSRGFELTAGFMTYL